MRCRICFDPLNTARHSIRSVYDFLTVEGIRMSIAGSLREIFPTLQEISKLDVPCYPTYVCDSCLKFLVVTYKFYIKCSKTNLKLQEINKEHQDVDRYYLPDTQHFKFRICCSQNSESTWKANEILLQKDNCDENTSSKNESTKVTLDVRYSIHNEHSVLKYLQLHRKDALNEKAISEDKKLSESYCDSLTVSEEKSLKQNCLLINCETVSHSNESEIEIISKSITEDYYNYEDELKKVLTLNNGQLPEYLQVYLEHRYCKFGFKYICEICKVSFPEEYLLKPHIEMCHINPHVMNSIDSKFVCVACGKKFKNFIALREHLKLQHIWYKCKVCQKQFLDMNKFELHVKKNHSGYRPFQCPICGKLFRTKLLFLEHEKYTHASEKPYSCNICNKKWMNLISLDMHIRTHIGEKSLKCQDCDESFNESDSLEQHRKLCHSTKKILHECDLCLAEFTNLSNLTKHMKTHKDYKPHCCVICDRHFPTLRHLKTHISVKHEEQKVLMCELCHMTYLNETDLITHVEQHV